MSSSARRSRSIHATASSMARSPGSTLRCRTAPCRSMSISPASCRPVRGPTSRSTARSRSSAWPNAGRPTYSTSATRSSSPTPAHTTSTTGSGSNEPHGVIPAFAGMTPCGSFEPDPVVLVVCAGVGEDDLVADVLYVGRPAFGQALDLDRAVDREVGPRTGRQLAGEIDIDLHGAVLHRRVDPGDLAIDDAVACIDLDRLADDDILGLGLGDAQLRHQVVRSRDTSEVGTRDHLLALLDRNQLQHAGDAGAHVQRVGLALAQVARTIELVQARLFGGDLGGHVVAELGDALHV